MWWVVVVGGWVYRAKTKTSSCSDEIELEELRAEQSLSTIFSIYFTSTLRSDRIIVLHYQSGTVYSIQYTVLFILKSINIAGLDILNKVDDIQGDLSAVTSQPLHQRPDSFPSTLLQHGLHSLQSLLPLDSSCPSVAQEGSEVLSPDLGPVAFFTKIFENINKFFPIS